MRTKKKILNKEKEVRREVLVVEGNTVRKQCAEPKPREKKSREESQSARENFNMRRNRERALEMNPLQVLFLTGALALVVVILGNYISVQSSLTTLIRTTQRNESELAKLKNENDSLENQLNYVNLDDISQKARALGMVYAGKNQVIHYKKTDSEYVRQFEDIPQNKKGTQEAPSLQQGEAAAADGR